MDDIEDIEELDIGKGDRETIKDVQIKIDRVIRKPGLKGWEEDETCQK